MLFSINRQATGCGKTIFAIHVSGSKCIFKMYKEFKKKNFNNQKFKTLIQKSAKIIVNLFIKWDVQMASKHCKNVQH